MSALVTVLSNYRRPGLLRATIAQLDAALPAGVRRVLFLDGVPPENFKSQLGLDPDRWALVVWENGPSGTREAMRRVLMTCSHLGDWARLVYCEDDLELGEGFADAALGEPVPPTCGLLSLCDWHEFRRRHEPAGARVVPAMGRDGTGLWGAQCLVFPRIVVEYLATRTDAEWGAYEHPDPAYRRPRDGCDASLSLLLSRSPWPDRAVLLPTVVEHAGRGRSTVADWHNVGQWPSPNFAGRGR
jgi:hypothetical protein